MHQLKPSERKHIFVINKAPLFLNVVRKLFYQEQFNVTTTNLVPKTFALIAVLQPDAVIIDLTMGEDEEVGWQLLEELHAAAATSGIPVLIVSNSPQLLTRAQEQVGRYGGQAHLAWPARDYEMLHAIETLVGTAWSLPVVPIAARP